MVNPELIKKAEALRAMHAGPAPLLLANVWDVASARIIEDAGFLAIATSSAGIAFARGFPDGQKIDRFQMFGNIKLITDAGQVPVTADVEAGYGDKPERAADTAGSVIQAGAAGLNLEDATGDSERPLVDLALQLEKIRAIREKAEERGVPLVVNA